MLLAAFLFGSQHNPSHMEGILGTASHCRGTPAHGQPTEARASGPPQPLPPPPAPATRAQTIPPQRPLQLRFPATLPHPLVLG